MTRTLMIFNRARFAKVAVLCVAALVGTLTAASRPAVATTSTLTIVSFTANTTRLDSAGGTVKLSGRVSGARKCLLLSKPKVHGLVSAVRCAGFDVSAVLRANTTAKAVSYVFTLKATNKGKGLTKSVTATVPGSLAMARRAIGVSAGTRHTCALLSSGRVKCWGDNQDDQLGGGTDNDSSKKPVAVPLVTAAIAVSAGNNYSCALLRGGRVKCWGSLAQADGIMHVMDSKPVAAGGIKTATDITVSSGFIENHVCALLRGGSVECWGANSYGQLGNGTKKFSKTPLKISGITNATAISAGDGYTCALVGSGHIKCWGMNSNGSLGNGTKKGSKTPVEVSGIANAVAVNAGPGHACALLRGGSVKCWGANDFEQLGNNTMKDSTRPVEVPGVAGATAVSAGHQHTCALLLGGGIKCWGSSNSGQLGNDSDIYRSAPVAVAGITRATAISAGEDHTCALLPAGRIKCWGANDAGQLGNGVLRYRTTPAQVSGLTDATSIAAGQDNTCALTSSGKIKCWGASYGNTPVEVSGITSATVIAIGNSHACALLVSGSIQCWGENLKGQLGNGSFDNSDTPVEVSGITGATDIAAGFVHTCALMPGGSIKCWGTVQKCPDSRGSSDVHCEILGYGRTPVDVSGITGATAIAGGDNHTCALLVSGGVKCWGDNREGQLGNGGNNASTTPVTVVGISSATAISAYGDTTCALLVSGGVKCWGHGTGVPRTVGGYLVSWSNTPVAIAGFNTARSIMVADNRTCALMVSGGIKCSGINNLGQLGNSTTKQSDVPVDVLGITSAAGIAAGQNHTCALLPSGSVKCWGDNYYGQIGNGVASTMSIVPVSVLGFA